VCAPRNLPGIMGPSGTAKTTLWRVLGAILKPADGRVSVFGETVHELDPRRLSALVGYVPQQLGLVRNLSALDNVLMGSLGRIGDAKSLFGLYPSDDVGKAQAALDLMGIARKSSEPVFRMSCVGHQRVTA